MGYTHRWRGWVSLDESFIETVRVFIDYSGVAIEGADGTGQPLLLADEEICLNGSKLLGETGDTFLLVQGVNHKTFAETARKGYDVVVCATLLLATARNKGFKASSDGTWNEAGWLAARELYTRVTGSAPIQPEEMGGLASYYRDRDGGYAHKAFALQGV